MLEMFCYILAILNLKLLVTFIHLSSFTLYMAVHSLSYNGFHICHMTNI